MPPELTDLTEHVSLTPYEAVGIPIAIVGAVLIAIATQLQHGGVAKVGANTTLDHDAKRGLNMAQLRGILARPSWLIGTVLFGVAILIQLTSLAFAPLIVVQPLGAIALVVTSVLNARVARIRLDRASIRAIAFCIGGIALFVAVAAIYAESLRVTETQLATILVILAVVLVAFGVAFLLLRHRGFPAVIYILAAGILYAFVATLAKVVIDRVKTLSFVGFRLGDSEWLTLLCVIGLIVAALLGGYFVQSAYSNGPPDLVVAGLTVVDPIVAITIGIVVLGEAASAPLWVVPVFLVAGALAIYGVFQLAKHHPQSQH